MRHVSMYSADPRTISQATLKKYTFVTCFCRDRQLDFNVRYIFTFYYPQAYEKDLDQPYTPACLKNEAEMMKMRDDKAVRMV